MKIPIPSQRSVIISGLISATGGLTAVGMLISFRIQGNNMLLGAEVWFICVALIGAALAGFVVASAFGRRGRVGQIIALTGAVMATTIGAWLGGLLMFGEIDGAMASVVMVGLTIVSSPIAGLIWVTSMVAAQYVALFLVPKVPADFDLIPGPNNL